MRRFSLFSALLLTSLALPASAQTNSTPLPPNDTLFRRARRMVGEGNGAAGRAMVDSLLKRAEEGSTAYGDALFWRGALAQTAGEAENDYRRVIVEYPLSHYADDALLAIVELEQARGDRAGALAHLQRFVREHPVSSARGIAALAAARLAFDQRDAKVGCAMITEARASAASTDVELRNQIDYFGSKCLNAATDVAVAPTVPAPTNPPRDTTTKKPQATPTQKATSVPTRTASVDTVMKSSKSTGSTANAVATDTVIRSTRTTSRSSKTAAFDSAVKAAARPAPVPAPVAPLKGKGSYTIQLAAYGTRADAEALVKKLQAKGVTARVSGEAKPFRVRLDFYPTRQAAQEEVAALKTRGIIGFVTEERSPVGKSP
ncbi:MAG: Sporulation protein [Gemmatimonadetes bacterium]|nr:Sporulation protein [Gemmatimonadota bacterium]